MIAGIGLGRWRTPAEAVGVLREERSFLPTAEGVSAGARTRALYATLYPALKNSYRQGAALFGG